MSKGSFCYTISDTTGWRRCQTLTTWMFHFFNQCQKETKPPPSKYLFTFYCHFLVWFLYPYPTIYSHLPVYSCVEGCLHHPGVPEQPELQMSALGTRRMHQMWTFLLGKVPNLPSWAMWCSGSSWCLGPYLSFSKKHRDGMAVLWHTGRIKISKLPSC